MGHRSCESNNGSLLLSCITFSASASSFAVSVGITSFDEGEEAEEEDFMGPKEEEEEDDRFSILRSRKLRREGTSSKGLL